MREKLIISDMKKRQEKQRRTDKRISKILKKRERHKVQPGIWRGLKEMGEQGRLTKRQILGMNKLAGKIQRLIDVGMDLRSEDFASEKDLAEAFYNAKNSEFYSNKIEEDRTVILKILSDYPAFSNWAGRLMGK